MSDKLFILYDARANAGDTDNAAVLVSARTWGEALRESANFLGQGAVWFEYRVGPGDTLINEKKRPGIMATAEAKKS